MRIEHSRLFDEFVSFWFETRVDEVLRYETYVDFLRNEWYTTKAGEARSILLRGQLDLGLSGDEIVEMIRPFIDMAIKGRSI